MVVEIFNYKFKEDKKMVARKYPKEMTIEWIFDVNPNPTKFEIESQRELWRYILGLLLRPVPEKAKEKLEDLSARSIPSQKSSHEPSRSTVIRKTSLRCTKCGLIWPAKYLPNGSYAPDSFNCPNGCYKNTRDS